MSEAARLVDIFGTEKDRVNCPFYWKMGACRHGEKCIRAHNKPLFSVTLLLPHMYDNPIAVQELDSSGREIKHTEEELTEHYAAFYEDLFLELWSIGPIDEINVCNNIAKHMVGNVYIKFKTVDDAKKAMQILTGRYYAGKLLKPEYSPVTDFNESRCRQYETGICTHQACNFMHLKRLERSFERELWGRVTKDTPPGLRARPPPRGRRDSRRGGRGRQRYYDRDYRDRDRGRERGGGGYRDRERYSGGGGGGGGGGRDRLHHSRGGGAAEGGYYDRQQQPQAHSQQPYYDPTSTQYPTAHAQPTAAPSASRLHYRREAPAPAASSAAPTSSAYSTAAGAYAHHSHSHSHHSHSGDLTGRKSGRRGYDQEAEERPRHRRRHY